MSGLAHYFEDEGIATTLISLVRLHSEIMRAPRALWVPFELGRPLGPPNDPAFQREVLSAALGLLESDRGPSVLVDFDREAPNSLPDEGWRCPIATDPSAAAPEDPAEMGRLLKVELDNVAPWHRKAAARFGRTTTGLGGLPIEGLVARLGEALKGTVPASPIKGLHRMQALRFAVDDIKAFYLEAAAAGDGRPSSRQLTDWFWQQSLAARAIHALREVALRSEDKVTRRIADGSLIPDDYLP